MLRIPHGHPAPFDEAGQGAAGAPGGTFGYMFPELQEVPDALLPVDEKTVPNLRRLGEAMCKEDSIVPVHSTIPSLYTYFGQFLSHEITRELRSNDLANLQERKLLPLLPEIISSKLLNGRTPRLDLDSIYGQSPEEEEKEKEGLRDGDRMRSGKVGLLKDSKDRKNISLRDRDDFDLPRVLVAKDPDEAGLAIIGDDRNDENLIIAQLHVAFLRAHNELIDRGFNYDDARRMLRQHFQWIVLNDFLMRIADPEIVNKILASNEKPHYQPSPDNLFMPLEFSAAAYRFGHGMIRDAYHLNSLLKPVPLIELFTRAAFRGLLGPDRPVFKALPETWIIDWGGFIDGGQNQARRIGVQLTNHLASLKDNRTGQPLADEAMLPVRNLLRGYLLRLPTGQAVAEHLGLTPLTASQIEKAAGPAQAQILRDTGLSTHTPLWYYVLVEQAAAFSEQLEAANDPARPGLDVSKMIPAHLGPVGSTIVAEVLIELVRQSKDSILGQPNWKPTLGSQNPSRFTLPELLKLGGVLSKEPIPLRREGPESLTNEAAFLFEWPGPPSN